MDDFFLAYDETSGFLHTMVPGSTVVEIKYNDMKTSGNFFRIMIGATLAKQRVYFLARRLVQLTGAKWKYFCLADLAKGQEGANVLRTPFVSLFTDVIIDLYPMGLDCLPVCEEIGYLETEDRELHSVGIKPFGSVVGFTR